jgi:hypothetical protein
MSSSDNLPVNHTEPPDEETIADLFSRFQPQPGQRFYQRMETQPWMKPEQRWRPILVWQAAALSLTLVLVVISVLFSPSLKAIAQEWLRFFTFANSDTATVQVTPPSPNGLTFLNLETDFTLTLAEVAALADFQIVVPVYLPEGYSFEGAKYDPRYQHVALYYTGPQGDFLLAQQPAGNYFTRIGASATVEPWQIGDITAEYVAGGWVLPPNDQQSVATRPPGVDAHWDPTAQQQTVRWQANGMQYEIISWGELDKEALMAVAASLEE